MIGVDHLHGLLKGSAFQNFEEAYFFSAQTLTTVGYGRISPVGIVANTVSSLEALTGIMTLAIITGLLYGRFVNPKAFIAYSKNALIAPFKGGKALMFRLAPTKNSNLSELNATVTMTMQVEENGVYKNQFFPLLLQLDKVMSLALSWTVVHPINEDSPLYNLTMEEIIEAKVQVIIFLKAFDEGFSSVVVSRTSYTWLEIVDNAKFNPMFRNSPTGDAILLELDKINDFSLLGEKIAEQEPARIAD
jgi:inward rectifier potassium channel